MRSTPVPRRTGTRAIGTLEPTRGSPAKDTRPSNRPGETAADSPAKDARPSNRPGETAADTSTEDRDPSDRDPGTSGQPFRDRQATSNRGRRDVEQSGAAGRWRAIAAWQGAQDRRSPSSSCMEGLSSFPGTIRRLCGRLSASSQETPSRRGHRHRHDRRPAPDDRPGAGPPATPAYAGRPAPHRERAARPRAGQPGDRGRPLDRQPRPRPARSRGGDRRQLGWAG